MEDLFKSWLDRCEGSWESHRRYLMGPKKNIDNLVTYFDTEVRGDKEWAVLWKSDRNEGEMILTLEGNVLTRSRNYFEGEDGTATELELIDDDTVVFHSSYGGMTYREEIRFLYGDQYRLRQTVGHPDGKPDKVIVVGQYWECKV